MAGLNCTLQDAAEQRQRTPHCHAAWPAEGSLLLDHLPFRVRALDAGGRRIPAGRVAFDVFCAVGYRATAGTAPRPRSPEGKRIERAVTIATVIEFAAAIVLPVIVSAAGHSDWVLPSIAITIGPLLLWLDHRVSVPRYRPVGWALTVGPLILVATMSATALVATTGIAAGVLLLVTAVAGFRDLAGVRRAAERLKAKEVVVPLSAGPRL